MTNSIDAKQAAEFLLEKNDILILCHKNPDGDTIGSAAGLLHALLGLGKRAAVLCQDSFAPRYAYMNIVLFENQFQPQFVVAVDVAGPQLLGANLANYSTNIDLCIDHHPSNSGYARHLCCDATCASTTQLMLEVIEEMNSTITPLIADCLYTGLITDTGCFKFSSTTSKTLRAGAQLIDAGARHAKLTDMFFMSKSKKTIQLEKYALNNLQFYYEDRCALVVLPKEILDEIEPSAVDIEGISGMPRAIEGVDVGITIRQIGDNVYKISVRTSEKADACNIAHGLGGGGHKRAAGCEVMANIETTKKAILKEVEQALCR